MTTYVKIKEMKGKENKNVIRVLQYIAEKQGYMRGNEIQYRKLYYDFLKDKFLNNAKKSNLSGFTVSIRQYRRLKVYRKGRFSIHTAVYLLTLYEIMLGYKEKANIGNIENNISYTTYIVNDLKTEINRVLTLPGAPPVLIDALKKVYDDFNTLDNKTGNSKIKIYNNIW